MKLWTGLLSGQLNEIAEQFNQSILVDQRLVFDDIIGSIAHVKMLGKCQIITPNEVSKIVAGLQEIYNQLENGQMQVDKNYEDIHTFVEVKLVEKIGNLGKKMHTGRSRNDQVTTDFRLYLRKQYHEIKDLLKKYVETILKLASQHTHTIMPGYTHLQAAQPITFAHHMMAYAFMSLRDIDRLNDFYKRLNVSPLGACALAGTTYSIDREYTANLLGFDTVMQNSIDAVSDRDYVLEFHSILGQISIHLSRLCEELVIWSSQPFKYVTLSDEFSTGSSIMPQKKNPDLAELIRGKAGRLIGNMNQAFMMLKGLPLTYSKDMQEDKEGLFESIDTLKMSLLIVSGMLETMTVNKEKMLVACKYGYLNATDLADYLVDKGMSFRDAHHLSAEIVGYCIQADIPLEDVSLEKYQTFSKLFKKDVYHKIELTTCVENRKSLGGPSAKEVERQIQWVADWLKKS